MTRRFLPSILLIWGLLVGLLGAGCTSGTPQEVIFGKTGGGEEKSEPAAPPADFVEVQAVDPLVDRAQEELSRTYRNFLEREPLGFDRELFVHISAELSRFWHIVTTERTEVLSLAPLDAAHRLMPVLVACFFLFCLWFADRQFWHLAVRWQSRTYSGLALWWTRLLRILITVAGRSLPVAAVIVVSYFPIQAIFERAAWTVLFTSLLWLVLAYRALHAFVVANFGLGLVRISDRDADRLALFAIWALRLIFGYFAIIELALTFGAGEDIVAFLYFGFKATLAVIPVYLYFCKSSVLALFPPHENSGSFYEKVRRGVARYYYWALTASILLLVMRAAGYVKAANFILLRGYAIFLLVTVVLIVGDRLRRAIRRKREEAQKQAQELYKNLAFVFRVVSVFVVAVGVLHLLELYEPLTSLLRIPIFRIGEARLSPFSILNAILIFSFAILLGRVIRAVLQLKVFPALNVDVGVGYAVNTLVSYALILIGFFVALSALGVNLSMLTVVVASLGVGIGFGLQTLTENLISGFILLFGRSVKKGDIITVGDAYGQVEAVGARSVLIKTADNYDLLIPSKEIVGSKIVNWSYKDSIVRVRVPVGVGYGSNPRVVEKVLVEAAKKHEQVLDEPAPEVWLTAFGDNSVNFMLLVFYNCREITRDRLIGQLNFHIWDALEQAGIEIPFPQRDLHLKSADFLPYLERAIERYASGGPRASAEPAKDEDADASKAEPARHEEAGAKPGPDPGSEER